MHISKAAKLVINRNNLCIHLFLLRSKGKSPKQGLTGAKNLNNAPRGGATPPTIDQIK